MTMMSLNFHRPAGHAPLILTACNQSSVGSVDPWTTGARDERQLGRWPAVLRDHVMLEVDAIRTVCTGTSMSRRWRRWAPWSATCGYVGPILYIPDAAFLESDAAQMNGIVLAGRIAIQCYSLVGNEPSPDPSAPLTRCASRFDFARVTKKAPA